VREAEFGRIFEENHLPLFRFALRLTGSPVEAEDIVQECFLELLRPGCSYDPDRTPIRTYLFGIVRNQSLKRLRKSVMPRETSQQTTPEGRVLQEEAGQVVAAAIARPPDIEKEVLILAHYEQLPLSEVAEIVEAEIGAVKSRLQRARETLRDALGSYAPDLKEKWERNR
jgi:RNA polymerase sigma-70 factor (ECF subfamily)